MGDPRRQARQQRRARLSIAAATLTLAGVLGLQAQASIDVVSTGALARIGLLADGFASAECSQTTVTATAQADTWVDENSPLASKGSDSILGVDGGSLNVDTGVPSGRARALVRFPLPPAIPEGCVLASAKLQLFSAEGSEGTRVEVTRLASGWSESSVSWNSQPAAAGHGVASWSRDGYMQWSVTAQVEAMLEVGNHGFRLRDAAEASELGGGGHGFYSREKGENPPRLVIRFAPPSEEPGGPPAPPSPAAVSCGQVIMESTLVTNDLLGCSGDGIVIGAPMIIVDLGGHTIDGVGLGSGVGNDGHASVTVRNGTVQEFDYGVNLLPETELNLIERLSLLRNEVSAVELFDVEATEIRDNRLHENGGGISLVSGTSHSVVVGNVVTANGKAGLLVRDSDHNRLEHNSVSGGGDLGIGLERAMGNTLIDNTVSENSDGAIELSAGSHENRVEDNTVVDSGDHGILVRESDRNELVDNTSQFMSDSGITLESANDGIVRGNDVRFNTGGLQVDGSSGNTIEANDASSTSGIGIELGGGSFENAVVANVAGDNGSTGILIADDATDPLGVPVPALGNMLVANVIEGNRSDGIVVAKGGHTIAANVARQNAGWGINAALNSIDGGLNVASGNAKPEQCIGVVCNAVPSTPETTITSAPPEVTNSSSASFVFSGSAGTTPPAELRFECRVDTVLESGWATCSSPLSFTGLAPGAHVFEVRAVHADSVDGTPARSAWTIDTTPPETTIQSEPDDETPSATASFGFSADEPDAAFACSLDGGPFESCASPAVYIRLADGRHNFLVVATDPAGNSDATPASHSWIVDATPPETTLDAAPAARTNNTSATFSFSSDEAGARFACSLDDSPFEPCQSPLAAAGLTDGEHSFEVQASDHVGNVDATPARHAWTIDRISPDTTIDFAPQVTTESRIASFRFSANELGAEFECSLDDAPFAACESPIEYTAVGLGGHSFLVRANDAAGNTDATPAAFAWTVVGPHDTTAPETSIDSGPAAETTSTEAVFLFSADELGARFECSLGGDAFLACESPIEYTRLGLGLHRFEVRAVDLAGNMDATPAVFAWVVVAPPDTTEPETVIDSGPPASTTSTEATFTFSSEPNASFECSLDGAPFSACDSPRLYRVGLGSHRFEVQAIDLAGNADASPAVHSWSVAPAPACPSVRLVSSADTWLDENSAVTNFGSDSILKVRSKGPRDRFRALVRFDLPTDVPQGCRVASATLRLFAASATSERLLHALRVAADWSESLVTWSNQPTTVGPPAATTSGAGARVWDVTGHVQAMLDADADYGFQIRDAEETADAEQSFHSREKGESPPQLDLVFLPGD